ncbi:hypothetical protein [Microbispora sp. NPDC049125]
MSTTVNGKVITCPDCGRGDNLAITNMDSSGGTATCMYDFRVFDF